MLGVYNAYSTTCQTQGSLGFASGQSCGLKWAGNLGAWTITTFGGHAYPTTISPAITYAHIDSLQDGFATIQGVRNVNQDTQQRTTPDAYAGGTADPLSQSPYMWNNNDPLGYDDPTGFSGDDLSGIVFSPSLWGYIGSYIEGVNGEDLAAITAGIGVQQELNRLNAEPDLEDGRYPNLRSAAEAAASKYLDEVVKNAGVEVGCAVYCTGPGACGYTQAETQGLSDSVGITLMEGKLTGVGEWHYHPGAFPDNVARIYSMGNHEEEARTADQERRSLGYTDRQYTMYTSFQNGSGWEQDYTGLNSNLPEYAQPYCVWGCR